MPTITLLKFKRPFDLLLSLQAAESFYPRLAGAPQSLRMAVTIVDEPTPTIIEIRQIHKKPFTLEACSTIPVDPKRLRDLAHWLVSADLDLRPFYRTAEHHPVMSAVVKRLKGLKPLRPASLFEMGIIAITEQQLSLAAAFHIRKRLVERFGEPVEDLRMFPRPESIAGASLDELRACGLSRQKTDYVRAFAQRVSGGRADLRRLEAQNGCRS